MCICAVLGSQNGGIGEQFVVELGRSGARGASHMTIVLLFFFLFILYPLILCSFFFKAIWTKWKVLFISTYVFFLYVDGSRSMLNITSRLYLAGVHRMTVDDP